MLSTHKASRLAEADCQALLDVAEQSIGFGLKTGRILQPDAATFPDHLRRVQSSFVTLRIGDQLRGCVGAIKASVPLVSDVSRHAFGAAFYDARFLTLREELAYMTIHISVLDPLQQLPAGTLAETVRRLRPGVHGVVLRLERQMATFLPDVWERLPDPVEFLAHLRLKAGLDRDVWSSQIQVSTYTTQRMYRKPCCALPNRR